MFDTALGIAYSLAIVWLVLGVSYRMWIWVRSQSGLPLPLMPAPRTHAGVIGRLLLELLTFRSLARASKATWIASLLFHYSLLWILVVHVRFLHEILPLWLLPFIRFSGYATTGLLLGLAILLVRRLSVERIRYVSGPSDYLHLLLLFSIAASGALLKRVWPTSLYEVGEFLRGTLRLDWQSLPDNTVLWIHLLLVLLLLLVFPISKLVHAMGVAFSPAFYQRDRS